MFGIEVVLHLQMKVSSNVYAIRASRQPPRIQLNRHEAVGENVLENFKSSRRCKNIKDITMVQIMGF